MNIAAHHSMMFKAASPTPPGPAYWGLCFTAEEPNVVVNMSASGPLATVTLETSSDGVNWTTFDAESGTTPITLPKIADKVYFRAGNEGNKTFSDGLEVHTFVLTGLCAASGNINSILDGNSQEVAITEGDTFNSLFYGCTSLTAAPALPATTLSTYCYNRMFYGCTSLTAAPALPATTLARYCYREMFRNCYSLNNIIVNFGAWSPTNSVNNWLNGVAATGTFSCPAKLGTDSTIARSVSRCPAGWTVINI